MLGSIGASPYAPYSSALSVSHAHPSAQSGTAQPAADVALPVQPVAAPREVISNDAKLSIESMMDQHASDPVAMAVRMRIQQSEHPGELTETEEEPGSKETRSAQDVVQEEECQTCENRKYQDGSDDPGVSFKTATQLSPDEAASAVRGHEMEHVVREQAKASREDREVISQSVTIKTAICPECGTVYAAGGETITVTKAKNNDEDSGEQQEAAQPSEQAAA